MKEFFPEVPVIKYEGPETDNPFAFRFYNPDEVIAGKKMREHLRFAMAYWHTLCFAGRDMFGEPTMSRNYNAPSDPMEAARQKAHAAMEVLDKLNLDYFCFHDRDIAPEADNLRDTNRNLEEIAKLLNQLKDEHGKKVLWVTQSLFTNPRYAHGAGTAPNADVFAFAAAQVKKAVEVANMMNAEGYVFWGGREGYETLLNTDMKLELDNMARLLRMSVDYARSIGFKGDFYIEPKPKEPTKHQYDFDAGNVIAFLRNYGLDHDFKLNIEANHATLAGHTFQHELCLARINNMLGSIDANQGDMLLGWDTDQFPSNVYDATLAMLEVLRAGGFTHGGLNFDAKVRRGSYQPDDIFLAHISGMDSFALGLRIASRMMADGVLEKNIANRYASYTTGIGKDIVDGKADLVSLEKYALEKGEVQSGPSGRQEYLETILNQYMFGKR